MIKKISIKSKTRTKNKLTGRCEILEKIIVALSNIYSDQSTTDDQKKLIETTLGATIWYLPHSDKYWTGKISQEAKNALANNGKLKLTKEHQLPRKIAAKELLMLKDSFLRNETRLEKLYEEKYAKFSFVMPSENKKISKYQRDDVFVDIETAYLNAKITLIDISKEELKKMKKGID